LIERYFLDERAATLKGDLHHESLTMTDVVWYMRAQDLLLK